ncbi:YncE family protein [Dysgonomonas sp. 25]|uniref:YncE family protein n=1 Tax=Dysgonomonas sp. 25 TaxID=2302933 RepID=UPI0013D10980|nr:DUF5074 domain-containing protein [Dysgonomonas sp. 25]NDV68741.1 YncE family protein [Dysgonomonas sp. 25]
MKQLILLLSAIVLLFASCREDEVIFPSHATAVTEPELDGEIEGFYLLNEGNMGMNRASIDFFNSRQGTYTVDIYSERNPTVVKELGDVGNDLKIYGDKLWAVINCSNKIEVMNKWTAQRVATIEVPNCRYLAFHDGKAYISSYAGPVSIDPDADQGFVAEIDTRTFQITRKVQVGYQPEEMIIHNGKLYVANSGGYRVPNYDRTISVIDLASFTEIKKIDVAINLHRMAIDSRGDIYVSSRGDHRKVPASLHVIDSNTDDVKQHLDIPVSEMCMVGDSLYYYSVGWSDITQTNNVTYGILDTRDKTVISDKIITDGSDSNIMIPYGLAVHPETKDIYITDAQNYIVTGLIYCFDKEGKLKWRTTAGNIPSNIAFVYR